MKCEMCREPLSKDTCDEALAEDLCNYCYQCWLGRKRFDLDQKVVLIKAGKITEGPRLLSELFNISKGEEVWKVD